MAHVVSFSDAALDRIERDLAALTADEAEVMAQTGMCVLSARRHLKDRTALRERAQAEHRARVAQCLDAWAGRVAAADAARSTTH